MTDLQLAVFLQKYLDKLNDVSKYTELHLKGVTSADITSPETAKIAIMDLLDTVTDDLVDDIAVLTHGKVTIRK